MKKIITISCFLVLLIALLSITGTQTSCNKQSTDCPCVVLVDDSNNNPVSGAAVKLYAPHGQVEGNGTTNSAGSISFNFALPAIFNVAVTKGIAANDTLKGSGIIQLVIGQTVSTTVVIK